MSETNLNTTRIKLPFAAVDDKPYIFASYAHNDNEIVFPLLKKLYEAGYNVWYDEGITIGERYDNVIKDHIEKSAVFLFFTSNLSVSRSYIIEKELPVAFKNRDYCTILTLYIEKKGRRTRKRRRHAPEKAPEKHRAGDQKTAQTANHSLRRAEGGTDRA